jgi:hypothetical protein
MLGWEGFISCCKRHFPCSNGGLTEGGEQLFLTVTQAAFTLITEKTQTQMLPSFLLCLWLDEVEEAKEIIEM